MAAPYCPIQDEIAQRLKAAVIALFPEAADRPLFVRACDNSAFGDYQTEFALSAAKALKKNPREVAAALCQRLAADTIFEKVQPAGPGFINLTLKNSYLESKAAELSATTAFPVQASLSGKTIVIDYSGPNIAKRMHIGHFRATMVGDAICRIIRFCGARVVSDNHLGDWGTQFGKLITAFRKWKDDKGYAADPVGEMERLYQKFQTEITTELEEEARLELVKLQQGEPENLALWKEFIAHSMVEFDAVYKRLGVTFDQTLGESRYHPMLPAVVEALVGKGIAHEDQDALIVDTDGRYQIHGPLIVRKKDGGFNYATTDLATIRFRLSEWKPDRIIYITDARQQDHFKAVFAVADEWLGPNAEKVHVYFGSIKGTDGKSFSTRAGNAVGLSGILDEAVERARKVVDEKNPDLPEAEKAAIATAVGLGSLKYTELNHDLKSDTIFDWDRMLSLEGNTAPYHLYTHARIRSVLRKCAGEHGEPPPSPKIAVRHQAERALIMLLDAFSGQVRSAAQDLKPNYVTEYLSRLGSEFNGYYNLKEAPVLKEPDRAVRESRTALYRLTGDTIRTALSLLGITALDRM